MITLQDRFIGSLLGLAVGDALGAPVEFKDRGSFPEIKIMQSGGPFNLEKGQWTDDTSLALCLAESLIESRGFDPIDQMKRYIRWYKEGYWSCTGHCFDIGNTTKKTIEKFIENQKIYGGSLTDPATNGSLMRLAPIVLAFYPDLKKILEYAGLSSRVTHEPLECQESCKLLSFFIFHALNGKSKDEMLKEKCKELNFTSRISEIYEQKYLKKSYQEISGKGEAYLSLEAALWCFYHTDSFQAALIKAVNLGDDTDTTAAIVGQLAGAYYSVQGIPKEYLQELWRRDDIEKMGNDIYEFNRASLNNP